MIPRFHLHLEPCDACDADCGMCCVRAARGGFRDRAGRGFMPERTLLALADQWAEFPAAAREATIPWAGEALLHPASGPLFSRLLSARGAVNLVTNGRTLGPERSRAFADAAAGRAEPFNILVSLDAAGEATYARVKGVGGFAAVVANARALLRARDRAGGRFPTLLLQFVLQAENAADLDRFPALATEIFAGRPHYLALEGRGIDTARDGVNLRTIGYLGRSATVDRAALADRVRAFGLPERGARTAADSPAAAFDPRPCAHLFENLNVHWTGATTVCCNDLDLRMAVGAFPDRSLADLFFAAPRLALLRDLHRAGRRADLTLCRDCVVHRPADPLAAAAF